VWKIRLKQDRLFFHGVENPARFFHGMEKFSGNFPRYGKLFSTVWKIWARRHSSAAS